MMIPGMIPTMVVAIIVIVLALIGVWLASPNFRAWTERPKTTLLERNEMFERAANDEFNNHTDNPR